MWHLCRLCKKEVEDTPHAMFECSGSPQLLALQYVFLANAFDVSPTLYQMALSATPVSFFLHVLSHRPICDILAKFAFDTLQIYQRT